jgi:menaquinone-dependent protoporphyrinogen oxidase
MSDPSPTASARVLVAYASQHGHTAKIAERLGTVLRRSGVDAVVCPVTAVAEADVAGAAGVIAAASVHAGHHEREMLRWLEAHADALGDRPTALVSASLTAADDTDEARATTQRLIDDVLEDTHWTPTATLAVAGALQYHAYHLPTKLLMRMIARRHGASDDTSQDVELTDWEGVERFAAAFAATVSAEHAGAAAGR